MKKGSKALLVLACAGCLVVGTVFGTLAYLTSTKSVTNTFTVGDVEIELDEAIVNEYGEEQTGRTEEGNSYKLIPGHTYVKDPTVTVAEGSENSYVRMIVKFNNASVLKTLLGTEVNGTTLFLPEKFVNGWDSSKWLSTTNIVEQDDTLTYEFRYVDVVDAREEAVELEALFESFTLPDEITKEQLKTFENFNITVEAHAIQADGFENAADAWNHFN